MIKILQYLTVFTAFVFLGLGIYECFYTDRATTWTTFREPQLAAFTSLEDEEKILEGLDEIYVQYNSYKPLDPAYFLKPNIFQTIERK